ncbi:MAG: FtsQ-type POTRA domain-containing protein [Spirochaetaceae bacterium]|jgi:cell division protein FtsQ|nr:FtsQ-type POTRA domain-containing protein [Spirochaetaceae bacterium]
MTGGYVIEEDEDEAIDVEKEGSFKFEKPLKKLIAVLAVLLCAEFVWLFLISPCMPLTEINITGIPELDKNAILRAAGVTQSTSYISINEKHMKKKLESIPRVESAFVSRRFPDSLNIVLRSRRLLAFSLVEGGGATYAVLFDENGVVFDVGLLAASPPKNAVLVSGIFTNEVKAGDAVPPELFEFLENLKKLREADENLLDSISEIYVNRKAYNTFDLLIYPEYNRTRIRMSSLNEDNLRYMFLLLDVFAEKNMDVEEIDFRTGTALYKIREQEGIVYER